MKQTKTYQHGGQSVTIEVDIHCGFVSTGKGDFVPVNCITATVGTEQKEIKDVKDADLDKTLARLEESINAFIDATPAISNQLQALGYN